MREIHQWMYEMHPDFLTKFDPRFDYVQNAIGNDDWQFDYEDYRNIVGIHRFNTIGKTIRERVAMEKSDVISLIAINH